MSNVYYKFASELNFNHVNFDGLHISVVDLKRAILHQKRLGKATDFDLLISNAETKEEYKDEHGLIPKNTSLIITRIPINNQHKKSWEVAQPSNEPTTRTFAPDVNHDISKMNGSEEDKIKMMMMQSAVDYDPTNYQRVRGNQTGEVPANYRCFKCQKPGHWIKNCPMNPPGKEYSYKQRPESKKMTGIPRSLRDNIGHEPQEPQFIVEEKREIPEELICTICKGIFRDAVMVPCCGSSFCDDCVRTALLESEDNECPDCKEKETSPGTLIPNRFLRKSVIDFLAESSNAMAREIKKVAEEEQVEMPSNELENVSQETGIENEGDFQDDPMADLPDQEHFLTPEKPSESEEEEDDDNITVTLPSAHQQCRGANFRDSRLRRIPSHGLESQSSVRSSQDDEAEGYGENNSDNYSNNRGGAGDRESKRSHNNNDRYEIPTLGADKNGNQGIYPIHSSSSGHSDYSSQQQQQQSSQNYQNPSQNSGMMQQQMHPQSMYQQNHYQGNYYPPNQMRPSMGYDQHQGNYQQHPIRHHQHHPMHHQGGGMMRPMNDNFGVRHPRPPINNLANAVSHDIQQRFGSGFIDDPLEAFNRIMREKEMRKERLRRSPQRHSPEFRRKIIVKPRKRSRSNGTKSISRSKSRSRSPRYRRKDSNRRHNSRERRDDRRDYRSPLRRGPNSSAGNRKSRSRSKYKTDSSSRHHGTQPKSSTEKQQLDRVDMQGHERDERPAEYEVNHNLDEQPPPPGDETVQPPSSILEKSEIEHTQQQKSHRDNEPESSNENSAVDEKKSGKTEKSGKSESSHHHKKSRRHDTPEDNEKREKKKRKKSKEHEKKKSKKDKREKKHSKSKSPSEKESKSKDDKTPEDIQPASVTDAPTTTNEEQPDTAPARESDAHEHVQDHNVSDSSIKRSDSILNLHAEDEFFPAESKWDREDDKSSDKNENFEVKTNPSEEKMITHEIIKRAENAIFAKAIREIRTTTSDTKKREESSDDARSGEQAKKLKKSPARGSIKSRLGVKVSDDSPRSRSKTPVRRKQPTSSCVKVNLSQESRSRVGRRSRSPRRSKSRGETRTAQNQPRRVSPRRRSRSRDLKTRRRSHSRSRERRDDRNRKQPYDNRQRKHSPEPSKKQDTTTKKPVRSTREREASRSKVDDKKLISTSSTNDEDAKQSTRAAEESSNAAKRTRDSSSSSSSTSNTDEGGEKRKAAKAKKKSRSPSAEHGSKRKKSKKEKKAKKKKKSKK